MKRRWLAILLLTSACAMTTVRPVDFGDRRTKGFRIYDSRPLLVVTDKATKVVLVPDYGRGYAINFHAWLAKNETNFKLTEGGLSEVTAGLDSTAFLTFLGDIAQKALEQVKELKALSAEVEGTLKGKEGIYQFEFTDRGDFVGLKKIM